MRLQRGLQRGVRFRAYSQFPARRVASRSPPPPVVTAVKMLQREYQILAVLARFRGLFEGRFPAM